MGKEDGRLPESAWYQSMTKIIYPDLSYVVQGCFYDVYNELRYVDLSEEGWEKALLIALKQSGVTAERQVEHELRYKGYRVGRFFVDVVVDDKLLLELKAREDVLPIDMAQVITYLKVTGLALGILVNFGGSELFFKRVPNFLDQGTSSRPLEPGARSVEQLLYPELTSQLRAALYEVHSELGPGFMHMHYRRSTQIELRRRSVPYEVKKEVTILFRGQPIENRETRLIIADERALLVTIAVREITTKLRGRLRQYLNLLGLKLGVIANFHTPRLEIETVRV